MSRLKLKEAPSFDDNIENTDLLDELTNDDSLEVQAPLDYELQEPLNDVEEEIDSIFIDETDPELTKFICSDELNELRDILIELPEDNHLLLLDNKVIVIAKNEPESMATFLYCLRDEDEEFTLIEMPIKLDEILANDSIIQYTPANISDVHDKVVELFARELEPANDLDNEEIPEESINDIEDNIDDNLDNDINDEIEEEDEDEEDKIKS